MTTHVSSSQAAATALGRTADLIMLGTLLVYSAAALAIGSYYGAPGLAAGVSLLLLLVGGAVFSTAAGSGLSRSVLALCLSAAVALHIHLGRGTLEFHFGVFVTLALLLVYRDWRPIVVSAAFFAVHHVAFDRMQAARHGRVLHAGTQLPEDRHARRLRGAADRPRGADRGAHGRHRAPGRRTLGAGARGRCRRPDLAGPGPRARHHGRRPGAQAGPGPRAADAAAGACLGGQRDHAPATRSPAATTT